eukprot:TRINITY_DN1382_c1_g1_i1.p3 TRINITY_DN1382_c1_g1~~TRINITY_DN1382_c1_g1_i1.p3  ORF type:complete len:102 (-),score=26.35 TRINITY_DN1382_c1_g1_i1:297-602(-)
MERVLRFPAAAPAGPGEDAPSFLPGDEADGTGLGPALVVLTYMAVPVEAPPLWRWWTAAAGGDGVFYHDGADPPPPVGPWRPRRPPSTAPPTAPMTRTMRL